MTNLNSEFVKTQHLPNPEAQEPCSSPPLRNRKIIIIIIIIIIFIFIFNFIFIFIFICILVILLCIPGRALPGGITGSVRRRTVSGSAPSVGKLDDIKDIQESSRTRFVGRLSATPVVSCKPKILPQRFGGEPTVSVFSREPGEGFLSESSK